MKSLGRVLIAAVLVFAFANSGWAGIVNNAGLTLTSEDSLCVMMSLLDTLGQPVAIDSTKDWIKILICKSDGDSVFADSMDIQENEPEIEIFKPGAAGMTSNLAFTYSVAVSDIDGTATGTLATRNGNYRYWILDRDSSLALYTMYTGEFQIVSTGTDVSPSEAIVDAATLTFNGTNVNANANEWDESSISDLDGTPDVNVTAVASGTIDLANDVTGILADANVATIGVDALSISGSAPTADSLESWATTAYGFTMMRYGDGVYVAQSGGTAGSTVGQHATIKTPTTTIASAKTVADALGLKRIYIDGDGVPGNALSIPATMEGYEFIGIGAIRNNQVNLNSQDVDFSRFENIRIAGTQGGASVAYFDNCILGSISGFSGIANNCWIEGPIVMGVNDSTFLSHCQSAVPGNNTPDIDLGTGASRVAIRHYSGGVRIKNGDGSDAISVETDGQVRIHTSCTSLPITVRGMASIVDSGTTTAWTYHATSQFFRDSLITKMQDSVLQALDYTNNIHNVVRNNQGDTVGYVANVGTTGTVTATLDANVVDWGGAGLTAALDGGLPRVSVGSVNTNAIGSGDIATAALNQIADTVWRQGYSQYRIDANYTTAAWKDSVMAAAFTGGTQTNSQRTAVRVDLDSAAGDLAAAQIETAAIDFGVELDTAGLGASGWAHGTRTLTALDEDGTTIDLDGSTIGTVTTVTNSPFTAANARSVADSVWEDRIAEHSQDSVFGGAFGYVPAGTRAFAVTDFDSAVGTIANSQVDDDVVVSATATVSAANMGSIADSVWRKATTGGPAYADGTFGDMAFNDSVAIDAIRDSMDEASATAALSAANMGSIADSVWGVAYTGGTSNIGAVAGSIGDSLNNPFGVNVKSVASATIEDQDINTIGVNVESVTDGAIVAADIALSTADKIGYATWHMTNDTTGVKWTTATDTSFAFLTHSWASAASLTAGNMGSIADSVWRKATVGGPAYADGTFGDMAVNDSIAIDAIRDSMDEASQAASLTAGNMGSIADSVWRKGGAKVRLSDGDTTAIAMLYHIRDSMDEASATGGSITAGNMGSIADSVWRKASTGGPAYADGTFGDVIKNDSVAIDAIRDSMDEASQTGTASLSAGTLGSIADSVWRKASIGGPVYADGTFGDVIKNDSIAIDAIRDSMDEASQTGLASIAAATMGSIADSVWRKATIGGPTYGDGTFGNLTRRDSIRIKEIIDSLDTQTWALTAAPAPSCGSGAQAVTIYVLDTSGTDELVSSYVTIYNSGMTATPAHGPAFGGVTGTFGLNASTAYKGLATAHGYYFPLYSFTTGSGVSHTDTIRGYDIPFSSGSSVPSGQQVQLYDWVISPSNDTLYGAEVEITLAGSSNFYTSTNLVPPARVVVYAGVNDGSANGGKWQETIFGTDSLFTSGVDNANYTITIHHKSLKFPVVYEGLSIPASATPTRLRTILDNQD